MIESNKVGKGIILGFEKYFYIWNILNESIKNTSF